MSGFGVHFDSALDTKLKRRTQTILEEQGWTREQFIETFGKSYL